jgi:hypothetical protein
VTPAGPPIAVRSKCPDRRRGPINRKDFFCLSNSGPLVRASFKEPTMSSRNNHYYRRPWEDSSGKDLPDDVLKEVSKSWSPSTWNAYLNSLEVPEREVLLPNFERVLIKHDAQNALKEYAASEIFEDSGNLYISEAIVKKSLLVLTFRQRQLVREVFFDGKSIKEAALNLQISYKPAIRTLRRALARLRRELEPRLKSKRVRLGRSS